MTPCAFPDCKVRIMYHVEGTFSLSANHRLVCGEHLEWAVAKHVGDEPVLIWTVA